MSKLNCKNKGFTLLELLLVLALASILIFGALAMYQIQLRNFKVDKTSLQMQQWMQAGMSFYVDCNIWPTDSKSDPNIIKAMLGQSTLTQDECPTHAGQVRQYMPLNSDKNGPFPNTYSFGPFGTSGTLFQVSTNIGDDAPTLESVGRMIAARLPNASSNVDESKDPKTVLVQATINVPGQSIGSHGFILDMQMVKSTELSHVKYPVQKDCPPGMSPIIVNAISNFEGKPGRGEKLNAPYKTTTTLNANMTDDFITPDLTVQTTDVSGDNPIQNQGANEVLLISACIPQRVNQ
jgi:prepilin-type N-terminal cleavage/methylation domain-containing protein